MLHRRVAADAAHEHRILPGAIERGDVAAVVAGIHHHDAWRIAQDGAGAGSGHGLLEFNGDGLAVPMNTGTRGRVAWTPPTRRRPGLSWSWPCKSGSFDNSQDCTVRHRIRPKPSVQKLRSQILNHVQFENRSLSWVKLRHSHNLLAAMKTL